MHKATEDCLVVARVPSASSRVSTPESATGSFTNPGVNVGHGDSFVSIASALSGVEYTLHGD